MSTAEGSWWERSRAKMEALASEYGGVAIGVYFTLFFGTWAAFTVAIARGFDAGGAAASAGYVGGAYIATKATQPIRIAATAALTPLVAKGIRRLRG
jgi:hypothetical protein